MKTRNHLEKYEENTRDFKDKRKKVSRAVFSYFDEQGIEYRKSFVAIPYTPENEFFKIAPIQIP